MSNARSSSARSMSPKSRISFAPATPRHRSSRPTSRSIRTLRRDSPHHRFYDKNFAVNLEVRSKRHRYNPTGPVTAMPPPVDVHPERAALYIKLRQEFPMAHAIGYIPPESAWRVAAFSLTGELDTYLAAIGRIAASYDEFLNFSIPSP